MESIVSDNSLNFPTLKKESAAATECLLMSHVQNSECPAYCNKVLVLYTNTTNTFKMSS